MARRVVLDSSAILAFLYEEPGAERVFVLMSDPDEDIAVSSVNLCEVATKLALDGGNASQVERNLRPFWRYCVDFDAAQATSSAEMVRSTRLYGLSLGDRACLALAAVRDAEAWTTDTAWKHVGMDIQKVFIRST